MADPVTVMTIGYQGRSVEAFLTTLVEANVDIVIDVRSKPISRRHDFSKRRLSSHLQSSGIDYHHMPELGMPIDLLDRKDPTTGNAEILAIYRERIGSKEAEIDHLTATSQSVTICLLCFEANPHHCHRSVVCDQLQEERGLQIRHL